MIAHQARHDCSNIEDASSQFLNASTRDALALFRAFGQREAGYAIVAITVDGPTRAAVRFGVDLESTLPGFIQRNNDDANLFFRPGEVRSGVDPAKAGDKDIDALNSLWVDIDPCSGETPTECRARVDSLCQRLEAAGLGPDALVSTGGGVQLHWFTARLAFTGSDALDRAWASGLLKRLARALGGDMAATNVSRLLRLPGTTNLPTKPKRAKGRLPAPATLTAARPYDPSRRDMGTVEAVETFVAAAEAWAAEHGYTPAWQGTAKGAEVPGSGGAAVPSRSDRKAAEHPSLPEWAARGLLSALGRVRNDLDRGTWANFSKAIALCCREAVGEGAVFDALHEFQDREVDRPETADPEALQRVLAEDSPPHHLGLREAVHLMRERGWTEGAGFLAKLDFFGLPVNDNSMPGKPPRAPKVAPADLPGSADALAAMNEWCAVAKVGGSAVVAMFGETGTVPSLMSKQAFFDLMAPQKLVGSDGRRVPIAPAWFGWSLRRTFLGGVRMLPQGINGEGLAVPADTLNTWMGFVSSPAEADGSGWATIRAYLLDLVCAGDRQLCAWLLNWLAHLVQFPHEKPGTALILKGPQGAGKTTLTDLLRAVFHPAHVVSADRPDALLGKFNAHLREALVVIADEAVFAGDPAANNRLKAFVTDGTITVEQKGIDSASVPSFHRLVMTSNEDHVIRAETDARRWAVFDVSGARVGDAAYFRGLHAVLRPDHAEVRAFLRDLAGMTVDRDGVRRAPTTGGLIGQIVQSLPAPQQWLYETLRDALPAAKPVTPQNAATAVPHDPDFRGGGGEWHTYATREALTQSFDKWTAGRRYLRGVSTNALGNLLKLFGPAVQVRGADGSRRRVVRLGTLAEARAAFAASYLRGVSDASVWGVEDEAAEGGAGDGTGGTGCAGDGTGLAFS